MSRTCLHVDQSINGQHADHVSLYRVTHPGRHERVVRVSIRSDSYRDQCYAHVDQWSGQSWERVWSILPGNMATPASLAYSRVEPWPQFDSDRLALLKIANQVFGFVEVRS